MVIFLRHSGVPRVRAYLAVWMSAGRSPNAKGERTVWLEEVWVDRLGAKRGPGESYSDES